MNEKIKDREIRNRIAGADSIKNLFIEAGAGSGKTRSLVHRVTGLIGKGSIKIENIAAVTFTRKAAAELKEKVQIWLEILLRKGDIPEPEKNNIRIALLNFEGSFMGTVHSFCAKLLRERPVEAGIDPCFEEIEEDDNLIYADIAWNEFIEKESYQGNPAFKFMESHGIAPKDLNLTYMHLINYPDVDIIKTSIPEPDFTDTKIEVKKFLKSFYSDLPKEEPPNGWDNLQTAIIRFNELIRMEHLNENRLFIQLLRMLNKSVTVQGTKWHGGKEEAEQNKQKMEEFQKDIVTPALGQWYQYLHKPLLDFIEQGVAYYEKWRKERSLVNFQDLLMATAYMLRTNREVRQYFKQRITHLLVDEFQDTDPIQAEIIMLLTGEDDSENNWRKLKPKPGSLFVVGDPKQSIYRFRRADIDIYNQVKSIFQKGAGEVFLLTTNFRSLTPIADITNEVFKTKFPEETNVYQAKFASLDTVRSTNDKYFSGVYKIEIQKIDKNSQEEIARQDADIISSWIKHCMNGNIELERTEDEKQSGMDSKPHPGDFMIITKVKKRLSSYAKALEERGIPYEISGGESFQDSDELSEILKIFKAISDPENPINIVAALRGQFFGVSDNELYLFKTSGGKFSIFARNRADPSIVNESLQKLKEYFQIAKCNSPITAIELIIERLGIIPLTISGKLGSSKTGNILKAIELLRENRIARNTSFGGLTDHLEKIVKSANKTDIDEMNISPGKTRQVRLMNLHKAKGLESTVVILADPVQGNKKEHNPFLHIKRKEQSSHGHFIIAQSKGDYAWDYIAKPLHWDKHSYEETEYAKAEQDRLDYVAVTRAKNILIVSSYNEGNKKKSWESLYPYLKKMPVLPAVKCTDTRSEKEKISATVNYLETNKHLAETRVQNTTKHSYKIETVTGIVKGNDSVRGGKTGGTGWGRIVHKALEFCGRGNIDKLPLIAGNWLTEEGRPQTDINILIDIIEKITKDKLWRRMMQSEKKYYEIPFGIQEKDVIISGAIDLIFKETDGWVIVDYKTDDFATNSAKKEIYQSQIDMYAKLWEKITGEKVKETLLCKV